MFEINGEKNKRVSSFIQKRLQKASGKVQGPKYMSQLYSVLEQLIRSFNQLSCALPCPVYLNLELSHLFSPFK